MSPVSSTSATPPLRGGSAPVHVLKSDLLDTLIPAHNKETAGKRVTKVSVNQLFAANAIRTVTHDGSTLIPMSGKQPAVLGEVAKSQFGGLTQKNYVTVETLATSLGRTTGDVQKLIAKNKVAPAKAYTKDMQPLFAVKDVENLGSGGLFGARKGAKSIAPVAADAVGQVRPKGRLAATVIGIAATASAGGLVTAGLAAGNNVASRAELIGGGTALSVTAVGSIALARAKGKGVVAPLSKAGIVGRAAVAAVVAGGASVWAGKTDTTFAKDIALGTVVAGSVVGVPAAGVWGVSKLAKGPMASAAAGVALVSLGAAGGAAFYSKFLAPGEDSATEPAPVEPEATDAVTDAPATDATTEEAAG
ncbi:MAG: hypothetical protein JWO69_1018 [Thermoleophilia bacterium]|jgi:hypothetical protein|nr:hypothetical protein [Thermoleophilia bacterium]